MACRIILSLSIVGLVSGYQSFMAKIPNAALVKNPFDAAEAWPGVGHIAAAGGGARNPFGIAFKAVDTVWTTDFCNADTDGDGESNGVELGDPDCVWVEGGTPAETTGITHPAICEPVTDAACITKNSWMTECGVDSTEECDDMQTTTPAGAGSLFISLLTIFSTILMSLCNINM